MLLAELFLGVAQVRLGLVRHDRAGGADLALDGGHGLTGGFADCAGNARDLGSGARAPTDLLDPGGHTTLVILGLSQVPAQTFLVGLLLGKRDVRCQIGL